MCLKKENILCYSTCTVYIRIEFKTVHSNLRRESIRVCISEREKNLVQLQFSLYNKWTLWYKKVALLYRGVLYVEVILYSKECNWYTRCCPLNGGVRYRECPLREAILYMHMYSIIEFQYWPTCTCTCIIHYCTLGNE